MRIGRLSTPTVFLIVLGVLGAVRPMAGQAADSTMPPAGTRVRLLLESPLEAYRGGAEPRPPESFIAILVAVDSRSVVVRRSRGADTLPTARVQGLEYSGRGYCSGGERRARCVVLGTTAGLGLGLLLSATVWGNNLDSCEFFPDDRECRPNVERRRKMRIAGIAGALGFVVGLAVGRESWTPVSPWPPPRE